MKIWVLVVSNTDRERVLKRKKRKMMFLDTEKGLRLKKHN